MNLHRFTMKNYNRIEFCNAVIQVSVLSNLSMKQAFLLSLKKAKQQKIKTGFISLMPEAWEQFRKFVVNNEHIFSKEEQTQEDEF